MVQLVARLSNTNNYFFGVKNMEFKPITVKLFKEVKNSTGN